VQAGGDAAANDDICLQEGVDGDPVLQEGENALQGRSACACWIGLLLEQQDELERVLLECVCSAAAAGTSFVVG